MSYNLETEDTPDHLDWRFTGQNEYTGTHYEVGQETDAGINYEALSPYFTLTPGRFKLHMGNITEKLSDLFYGTEKTDEMDYLTSDFQDALEYQSGVMPSRRLFGGMEDVLRETGEYIGESIDPMYTYSEIDAIRHYYGPKLFAAQYGLPTAAAVSFGHELKSGVKGWDKGGEEDFWNNYISLKDHVDDTGYSGSEFYDIMRTTGEDLDQERFKEFADYALSRTQVPQEGPKINQIVSQASEKDYNIDEENMFSRMLNFANEGIFDR